MRRGVRGSRPLAKESWQSGPRRRGLIEADDRDIAGGGDRSSGKEQPSKTDAVFERGDGRDPRRRKANRPRQQSEHGGPTDAAHREALMCARGRAD